MASTTPRRSAIEAALQRIAPKIPTAERAGILDHATDSRGLKTASPEAAAWLSLVAYARHVHTDYDDLLAEGYDSQSAHHFCLAALNRVLKDWGCRKTIADTEDPER